MRKLRQLIYPMLLGTLIVLIFPGYAVLAMFSVFMLLMIMQRLNTYKIAMLLKQLVRKTQKLYFENKLNLRTGIRSYSDDNIENCKSVRCR